MGVRQTSLDAFFALDSVKLNKKQQEVLATLELLGVACNKQIAESLEWPINTVTPRVLELRTKGKVKEAFVSVHEGRRVTFWKPTGRPEKGVNASD